MASKESFEMMMIPKWLDAGHIPIENRAGAEEIPMEASIGRSYGKSRISYYSSHEGKSRIYLARARLKLR